MATTAPREFFEQVWPWFLDALSNADARTTGAGTYRDDYLINRMWKRIGEWARQLP